MEWNALNPHIQKLNLSYKHEILKNKFLMLQQTA